MIRSLLFIVFSLFLSSSVWVSAADVCEGSVTYLQIKVENKTDDRTFKCTLDSWGDSTDDYVTLSKNMEMGEFGPDKKVYVRLCPHYPERKVYGEMTCAFSDGDEIFKHNWSLTSPDVSITGSAKYKINKNDYERNPDAEDRVRVETEISDKTGDRDAHLTLRAKIRDK